VADLPHVTVELDSGPFEMALAYVPVGEPAYSDVPARLAGLPTYGDAEMVGARMLAVGNWSKFHVEKVFVPAEQSGSSSAP
jgi:hypothetical protein